MAVTVNAAIIDEKDTVVVAIEKINAGDEVIWRDRNGDVQKITAATDVPMYHKVAIKEMPKGTEVVKYGEHIGLAACDIHVGEHVMYIMSRITEKIFKIRNIRRQEEV